jgi:protein phosphatase
MLRVAESAYRTDTGRQRSANEDSYFARAPVFAVADGMGGAQAGEVASGIAAEAFEPGNVGDEAPEVYLRRVATEANARIHDLSRQDSSRSGMGTTLTAILVDGDEVSIAHVGDSRAYVFRDGKLKRLTSDHSLVEELRRQGRLTEQQAEEHPQRSIITRALGPEPEVDVDTMTYPARPGDVFLLCSDGLTTMLSEQQIERVVAAAPSLDELSLQLVRDANEAGGRDNITVVAVRLEDAAAAPEPEEGKTLIGPSAAEQGLTAETVRAAARRRGEVEPRRRWPRRLIWTGVVVAVLALLTAAAVYGARQVYFLGADEGGRISLYRGLPYELPFGINLYSEQESSPVQVSALPSDRQDSAINHELRGHDDALSLYRDLVQEALTAPAQPAPGSGPNPPGQESDGSQGEGTNLPEGLEGPGDGGTGEGALRGLPEEGGSDSKPPEEDPSTRDSGEAARNKQ